MPEELHAEEKYEDESAIVQESFPADSGRRGIAGALRDHCDRPG
jgi:hypothetical protein